MKPQIRVEAGRKRVRDQRDAADQGPKARGARVLIDLVRVAADVSWALGRSIRPRWWSGSG
jgi:hypothetical protein